MLPKRVKPPKIPVIFFTMTEHNYVFQAFYLHAVNNQPQLRETFPNSLEIKQYN